MSSIFNKRELNVFEWSFFLPSFVIFPHLSLASPNLTYTTFLFFIWPIDIETNQQIEDNLFSL